MEACGRESPSVFTLQSHEIEENWHWIVPLLMRCERADWTPAEVKDALESRNAQLWGHHLGGRVAGIWITQIENGTRGLLWIAAGSDVRDGLKLFHEHTEPWLKSMGCTSIRIIGRRGWKKLLPEYQEGGLILEKAL